MASLIVAGDTSGSVTIAAPAIASTPTLTLPTVSGTFITTGSSGQVIPKAALPTGSVLQVVQAQKIDSFSTTSTTYTDITGLSVSITPSASSSKILVLISVEVSPDGSNFAPMKLVRNSTDIAYPSPTTTYDGSINSFTANSLCLTSYALNWLDSPATTSSTTYKLQMYTTGATAYVNRRAVDNTRTVSTLTVMEIAA